VKCGLNSALIELHLATGNPQAALRVAEENSLAEADSRILWREQDQINLARALIGSKRFEDALSKLSPVAETAEAAGRFGRLLETLILQALALRGCGRTAAALSGVRRSLDLAAPEGFVRIFLDEGKPMRKLLAEMTAHGHKDLASYADRLAGAFARQ
jgi:LuxR family maltose regulon positive regulatory protein